MIKKVKDFLRGFGMLASTGIVVGAMVYLLSPSYADTSWDIWRYISAGVVTIAITIFCTIIGNTD